VERLAKARLSPVYKPRHINSIFTVNTSILYIYFTKDLLKYIVKNTFWLPIIRDYYTTFSISALVSARDSYIKPDIEAGGLIWVEGWYQGRYGNVHVIIYLSHILHWLFSSLDFYIAKKIFELINCENKSLRVLPLFNLEIFLFRVWFQKEIFKKCRSVQWR
jgi:hypothetical protein